MDNAGRGQINLPALFRMHQEIWLWNCEFSVDRKVIHGRPFESMDLSLLRQLAKPHCVIFDGPPSVRCENSQRTRTNLSRHRLWL
jgi:hypothetical protein